jgi:hypothetical protein
MKKTPTDGVSLYPALTGSKTPPQDLERNEKDRWRATAACVQLIWVNKMLPQDVALFTFVPLAQWG